MGMTTIQAAKFALMPGEIELVEKKMRRGSYPTSARIILDAKQAREFLYTSAAATIIAATAAAFLQENTGEKYLYSSLAIFSGSIMAAAAKKLYNATMLFQSRVNDGLAPFWNFE